MRPVSESQPNEGGSDAERADAEDVPLNRDEVGETPGSRPFRQAVGVARTDRNGAVHPSARGATADQRCDRAVVGRDREGKIVGRQQVGGAAENRRLVVRRHPQAQMPGPMRRSIPAPARRESESGAAE